MTEILTSRCYLWAKFKLWIPYDRLWYKYVFLYIFSIADKINHGHFDAQYVTHTIDVIEINDNDFLSPKNILKISLFMGKKPFCSDNQEWIALFFALNEKLMCILCFSQIPLTCNQWLFWIVSPSRALTGDTEPSISVKKRRHQLQKKLWKKNNKKKDGRPQFVLAQTRSKKS